MDELREIFERAECRGAILVSSLTDGASVGLHGDEPVVLASVVKVPIALEAERRFADGRLDPQRRVTLPAADRSPGPVGFSLFRDDVTVSARDLVAPTLTISDNVATDALLAMIGVDELNAALATLGLTDTVVTGNEREVVDSIGRDAGFAGWDELARWFDTDPPADQVRRVDGLVRAARELTPATGTRSTARQQVELLRLIWSDAAAPAAACARVRELMGRQLTRNRIAAGFAPPVRVAAKSGGLAGVIRNEIGVVSCPDGRGYAVAAFTRTDRSGQERPMNAAIAAAAAAAVESLRAAGH
ncbi:serine hydrolase [Actinocatenispora thailandica]|uniref:serine hydrolase n=1 Tax=Actinocatenispora thailandica TaxID=227318 RepID=UPI001950CCAD|nr:serine hydrolase [Actinocatenispora thailandica]